MYGLLITLGIATSVIFIERTLTTKLEKVILWDGLFWTILLGVIGARIYFVLEHWEIYSQNPILIPKIWTGGLQIIGGLIVGTATLIIYLKNKKQPILFWLDKIAVAMPLGHVIGRLGNYFNNEHLPYAYYEIPSNLLLFAILCTYSKKKLKTGTLFYTYIIGYSIIRIILEETRHMHWIIQGINVAQAISATTLLVAGVLLWKNLLQKTQVKKQ